jgi:hypothetical protein
MHSDPATPTRFACSRPASLRHSVDEHVGLSPAIEMNVARLDRPRAAAPGPAEATGAHDARNTPHPGSTVTKPATLSSSTARRAVLTLTSYSVAIARTLGSCSPGNHSPASMRSRRAALTAR